MFLPKEEGSCSQDAEFSKVFKLCPRFQSGYNCFRGVGGLEGGGSNKHCLPDLLVPFKILWDVSFFLPGIPNQSSPTVDSLIYLKTEEKNISSLLLPKTACS